MSIKTSAVVKILNILQGIQTVHPEFPIQYAVCLLEISQNEGLSLTDLSKRINMPLSTVSRVIGALSNHRQNGKAFGLVTVKISSHERRRKELYLSPRGKQLIHDLTNILDKDQDQRLRA